MAIANARQAATRDADSTGAEPLSVPERSELLWLRAIVAAQTKQIAFLEQVSAYFAVAASKARPLELIAAQRARFTAAKS